MTKQDTERLFSLLHEFYPNAKFGSNRILAWSLALEPYSYEAIRAAALEYVRHKKYFPDLADLTAKISIASDSEKKAVQRLLDGTART